ncbi:MAG: hypothetical protein IPG25_13345 [Proteobacteria bacterium]|nr:hypothetical protein [Pseudomonadota bacterium]
MNDLALGAIVAVLAAVPLSIALFAAADLLPAQWRSRLARHRLFRIAALLLLLPALPFAFATLWAWSGAAHLKPLCLAYAEPRIASASLAAVRDGVTVSVSKDSRLRENSRWFQTQVDSYTLRDQASGTRLAAADDIRLRAGRATYHCGISSSRLPTRQSPSYDADSQGIPAAVILLARQIEAGALKPENRDPAD